MLSPDVLRLSMADFGRGSWRCMGITESVNERIGEKANRRVGEEELSSVAVFTACDSRGMGLWAGSRSALSRPLAGADLLFSLPCRCVAPIGVGWFPEPTSAQQSRWTVGSRPTIVSRWDVEAQVAAPTERNVDSPASGTCLKT